MTRNDEHEQQKLGRCLSMEFEIKTLVKLKYLLWIEVAHSKERIFISWQKYITNLLEENKYNDLQIMWAHKFIQM